jgi:16S rRNA (guanine966-N2)-methyltransferase
VEGAVSLRVQSGTARGRRMVAVPRGLEVRPILARIRKSLFDIIRPRIQGAPFLDLFAGTGMVGIEALSNGASKAVFVDVRGDSLKMIRANLDHLNFWDRAETVKADATRDLKAAGGRAYAVVFMGPPYKNEKGTPLALAAPALAQVAAAGLLAPGGWAVVQHHEKESLAAAVDRWELFRVKEYGDTHLSFLKEKR